MGTNGTLLEVQNLDLRFGENLKDMPVVHALQGVSFKLGKETMMGIVGESGSGKSVTAFSIMQLLPSTARIANGHIIYRGEDILKYNKKQLTAFRGCEVGMIFQNAQTALNPLFSVGEQIAHIFRYHNPNVGKKAAMEKAVDILDKMGIPNASVRAHDYPHQYSGGMGQRAMIAMAMVCNPSLLIADEPTTALDVTTQIQILDLITDVITEMKSSLILITHDIGVVDEVCSEVAVMYAGRIMEYGNIEKVLHKSSSPYTKGLMRCFQAAGGERMSYIPGNVPDLKVLYQGCSFAERCDQAIDICYRETPSEKQVEDDHFVFCHQA